MVLWELLPELVGMEGRVYDSHPSSPAAAFRMENMSLDIIIDTYLVVARDDETVSTVDSGRTHTCTPLEFASHPSAKAGRWRVSLNFLRRKTTHTFLVLLEQPAVNTKYVKDRMKAIAAECVQNQITHSTRDERKGEYYMRGEDDREV